MPGARLVGERRVAGPAGREAAEKDRREQDEAGEHVSHIVSDSMRGKAIRREPIMIGTR